jgi:hypothetical protein
VNFISRGSLGCIKFSGERSARIVAALDDGAVGGFDGETFRSDVERRKSRLALETG